MKLLFKRFWFKIIIIFLCIQLIELQQAKENKGENEIHYLIKSFIQCDGKEDLPVVFNNVTIEQINKEKFLMNGILKIQKELGPEILGSATARYCPDIDVPDSCEFVIQDYIFGDVCQLITDETGEWNVFVKNLNIPPKCPIQPGDLKINNLQVQNGFQDNLQLPPGLWKIELQSYVNNVEIACTYMEVII